MGENDGYNVPGGLQRLDERVDIGGRLVRGRAIVVHYLENGHLSIASFLAHLARMLTRICMAIKIRVCRIGTSWYVQSVK